MQATFISKGQCRVIAEIMGCNVINNDTLTTEINAETLKDNFSFAGPFSSALGGIWRIKGGVPVTGGTFGGGLPDICAT